jgi:UDP-glucose 4-epimerase
MRWFAASHDFQAISLRYFNVAGATERNGEDHDPETHLVPIVLRVAAGEATHVQIFGQDYPTPDGTCIRDFLHVRDLAAAHLLALEATGEGDPSFEVYNLGSAAGFSVREVVEAARKVTGRAIPARVVKRRSGDPPVLVASSRRARRELGWQPQHSKLEQMLADAWAWRLTHPTGYAKPPRPEAGGPDRSATDGRGERQVQRPGAAASV